MVSSKFSVKPPPLRVPAVCKKKLEPPEEEEEGNPDPTAPLMDWYDFDVTWLWFHYVFSGQIELTQTSETHWEGTTEDPDNGQRVTFDCNTETKEFAAWLAHFVGGAQMVSAIKNIGPYPEHPNFDTEVFEYYVPLFVGKKDGRIYNNS